MRLRTEDGEQIIPFTNPVNIQLPMIEQVSRYFLGEGPSPCPSSDGLRVMEIIDAFSQGRKGGSES